MNKTGFLTKTVAVAGVLLIWFPIVATVSTSVMGSTRDGTFRFDLLLPAELFPFALIGGALLFFAAMRARFRQRLIGWGLAVMVAMLFGGQALAVATGLASGESEPAGWPWILVVASLVAYTLALLAVAWAGVSLLRRLFRSGGDGSA